MQMEYVNEPAPNKKIEEKKHNKLISESGVVWLSLLLICYI